jgi:hypothetical protein
LKYRVETRMTKRWTAYVTVYHKFEVEGDTWDEAHDDATHTIWDDHIKEVEINLEEHEDVS